MVHLRTKRGTQIVAAYYPCKAARQTLLFSHGNAVDLGLMLPFYRWRLLPTTPRQHAPACEALCMPLNSNVCSVV